MCGVDVGMIPTYGIPVGGSLRVRSGLLLTCGCVVALPLRDVGAGWAARGVFPAFRPGDACTGGDSLKRAVVDRSWSLGVQSGREDGDASQGQPRCIPAGAEWPSARGCRGRGGSVYLCVCGVSAVYLKDVEPGRGASLRVQIEPVHHLWQAAQRRYISAWGSNSCSCNSACAKWTPAPTRSLAPCSVHLCACGPYMVVNRVFPGRTPVHLRWTRTGRGRR